MKNKEVKYVVAVDHDYEPWLSYFDTLEGAEAYYREVVEDKEECCDDIGGKERTVVLAQVIMTHKFKSEW